MAIQDDALLKEFLIESYDGLNLIKNLLNVLEKDPSSIENINDLFRCVHTLKGSASFLGFTQLKKLSHSVESVLDLLRQQTLIFNIDIYEVLIESFDFLQTILKKIEETNNEEGVDVDSVSTKLELFLEMAGLPMGEKMASSQKEVDVKDQVKEEIKEEVKVKDHNAELVPKEIGSNNVIESDAKKSSSVIDSVVKVNVKVLDLIMNIIGELVVNRNQILQYTSKFDDFELQKLTHQLDVVTAELQNKIMSTRMQPVGQILNKFERVVRDLARSQDKKIQLIISGQETELDKTLIEAIKDPLTHLIRNAVDHGIEQSHDRLKTKKNEQATLRLMALHENGKVSIKIQDDGRGIDHEKIKAKAIEKEIISKEAADKMSVKELVNLIFAPGFSTAEAITDISGRGVGMDVVRTNIERIGGEIDIQTIKGIGTTITLKIPLTLAIIPSLTVSSHQKAYCIPQLNIVEFVMLDLTQENSSLHHMHGVNFFRLREKLIPIFSLSSILESDNPVLLNSFASIDFMNIVVVSGDGQEYGLVVDKIFDIEEIVVKPLSKNLKNLEYYSGATVMGSGEIALILETSCIIKKINPNRVKNEIKTDQNVKVLVNRHDGTRDFLVFSLRDNKKYGISFSFIDRIEEIRIQDLNFSGTRIFTKYRDQVMPLIDVQYCLNSSLQLKLQDETVQVLVVNVQGHLVGLIVNHVFDTLTILNEIDEFANTHPSLSGTVFVDNDAVLILNLRHVLNTINIQIIDQHDKKILYHIDDSKMHKSVFKDIIDTEFPNVFEVVSFNDPIEFLTFLKNHDESVKDSSIIVTDIDMPKMDGWELTKNLNNQFFHKKFNILTLTSRDKIEDKEKSKDLKILFHLIKFNKFEIVKSVNSLLGWSHQATSEILVEAVEQPSQFCGFKIGKDVYAIPIENVQEVVKAQFISSVPKSSIEVKGLINLRGQIVTSISLSDVFQYNQPLNADHMNIIVKNNEGYASLMVDEILDVMNFSEGQHSQVPENVSANLRKYFECVYKKPNELVTIVNVSSILDDLL
jgi:two-component system chemotaxis sensor kinase CheA